MEAHSVFPQQHARESYEPTRVRCLEDSSRTEDAILRLPHLTLRLALLALAAAVVGAEAAPNVKTLPAAAVAHDGHLQTLQREFTDMYRGSRFEQTCNCAA